MIYVDDLLRKLCHFLGSNALILTTASGIEKGDKMDFLVPM